MWKWTGCVLLFGLFLQVLGTIVINELSGLESAQEGSNSTTIGCDYQYKDEKGVEVKWFYNQTIQIFLWVPDKNQPVAMGPFRSILEVDNNTIRFKETPRNLTGSYTCKVSSFDTEAEKTQIMIVYQPPRLIEFFSEDATDSVICSASDVYPRPIVTITGTYVTGSNDSIPFVDKRENVDETPEQAFSVTKTYSFDKGALQDSVEFVCNILIPETDYNETRSVTYEKPKGDESTTDYPNYDSTTETSFNSTTDYPDQSDSATETTIYSATIKSTTQGGFAPPACAPSAILVVVLSLLGWTSCC